MSNCRVQLKNGENLYVGSVLFDHGEHIFRNKCGEVILVLNWDEVVYVMEVD